MSTEPQYIPTSQFLQLKPNFSNSSVKGFTEVVFSDVSKDATVVDESLSQTYPTTNPTTRICDEQVKKSFLLNLKPFHTKSDRFSASERMKSLRINCRQLEVSCITIQDEKTRFQQLEFFRTNQKYLKLGPKNLFSFSGIYASNLQSSLLGDLFVQIPSKFAKAKTIRLKIWYTLNQPKSGIYFEDSCCFSYHGMLSGEIYGGNCGPQLWFPCVNSFQVRFPLRFQLIIPERLIGVASGRCTSTQLIPDSDLKLVTFDHQNPVGAYNVAFCVGSFTKQTKSIRNSKKKFHIYYIEEKEVDYSEDLNLAEHLAENVILHLKDTLEADAPFEEYHQVFLEPKIFPAKLACPYSGISFLSMDLVLSKKQCKNVPLLESLISMQTFCLAYSYFGSLIALEMNIDLWLIPGICWLMTYRYLKAFIQVGSFFFADKENSKPIFWKDLGLRPLFDGKELLDTIKEILVKAENTIALNKKVKGSAGYVYVRPLQQPDHENFPVDALLYQAKGIDITSTISLTSFFVLHVLRQSVTDSSLIKVFKVWIRLSLEKKKKNFYGMSLRDLFSRLKALSSDYDNAHDKFFSVWMSKKTSERNFSFSAIRTFLKYDKRKNSIELNVSLPDSSSKVSSSTLQKSSSPTKESLSSIGQVKIRVVEDDGVFDHNLTLVKLQQHFEIEVNSQPHKKRGGRKSQLELDRRKQWDNPQELPYNRLLDLTAGTHLAISQAGYVTNMARAEARRLSSKKKSTGLHTTLLSMLPYLQMRKKKYWIKETPIKYILVDPEYFLLGDIQWRQSDEIMSLELLHHSDLDAELVTQKFTLMQMAKNFSNLKEMDFNFRAAGSGSPGESQNVNKGIEKEKTQVATVLRTASSIAAVCLNYTKPTAVRVAAVEALGTWQNEVSRAINSEVRWALIGLKLLYTVFERLFFGIHKVKNPTTPEQKKGKNKLLFNDFMVTGEFSMKLALVKCIGSIVRNRDGIPHDSQVNFMLQTLTENDNSKNNFEDSFYLSQLIYSSAECIADIVYYQRRKMELEAKKQYSLTKLKVKTTDELCHGKRRPFLQKLNNLLLVEEAKVTVNSDSTGETVAACLRSFALLARKRVIAPEEFEEFGFPKFENYVAPSWPLAVSTAAYASIIDVYLTHETFDPTKENNLHWFKVFKWLLVSVETLEYPTLQLNVLEKLLKSYHNSLGVKYEQLKRNSSSAGLFFPLSHPEDFLRSLGAYNLTMEIIDILWRMLNVSFVYNNRLLLLTHQLWRSIWGFKLPPVLRLAEFENVQLGPYSRWIWAWEFEGMVDDTFDALVPGPHKSRQVSAKPGEAARTVRKLRLNLKQLKSS
eukprot:snap_masked-scaffold_5-processed-gene-13.57-mRNA-1 protein AED:1.00 eAED:1.00 QI:0/0/0/0/1/1/2/0/1323